MMLLLLLVLRVSGQICEKLLSCGCSRARVLHLLLMLLDHSLLGLLLQNSGLLQSCSLLGDVMGR